MRLRALLWVASILAIVPSGFATATSWHVVCDVTTGKVIVTDVVSTQHHRLLGGPLPSRRTAEMWLAEHCTRDGCDTGPCSPTTDREPETNEWVAGEVTSRDGDMGSGDGWVAGEVQSETLSAPTQLAGPTRSVGPRGPTGPTGRGRDALQPLIDNASVAVDHCNFNAALLTADHMVNFDPEHPWLKANHQRLRELAQRQRGTEEVVWQASAELQSGNFKKARKLAQAAADNAVSCQSRAVSELLRGIETAIEQRRQMRSAKNRTAMAALLPGLLDLANAAIANSNGVAPSSSSPVPGQAIAPSAGGWNLSYTPPDPCAFKYEYRNVWNPEPSCTCPGYRFDGTRHQCVK